jgi:hypothetical protein
VLRECHKSALVGRVSRIGSVRSIMRISRGIRFSSVSKARRVSIRGFKGYLCECILV